MGFGLLISSSFLIGFSFARTSFFLRFVAVGSMLLRYGSFWVWVLLDCFPLNLSCLLFPLENISCRLTMILITSPGVLSVCRVVFSEVSLGRFWYLMEIDQFLVLSIIVAVLIAFPLRLLHVAIAISVVYCLNLLFRPIVMYVQ